jgi:hypothetical protein
VNDFEGGLFLRFSLNDCIEDSSESLRELGLS